MERSDGERLASLETEVRGIVLDVSEIKKDVKTLLLANAGSVGAVQLIQRIAPFLAMAISLYAISRG